MFEYIVYCMMLFFMVLEWFTLIYLVLLFFPLGKRIREIVEVLMEPMLLPMERIVQHSVLQVFSFDISPYIILIVLSYLENVCKYLLEI